VMGVCSSIGKVGRRGQEERRWSGGEFVFSLRRLEWDGEGRMKQSCDGRATGMRCGSEAFAVSSLSHSLNCHAAL
jgi:hypothetical protein